MFFSKKDIPEIDLQQREFFEHASARMRQKKRLFMHFLIFLVGAIFLIASNLILGIGKELTIAGIDWFVWAIGAWLFVLMIHFCRVWLFHNFMGKDWEKREMDKLIARQKRCITEMERHVEREFPLPSISKAGSPSNSETPISNPDKASDNIPPLLP